MSFIVEAFVAIRDFFEAGGNVLWAILAVTVVMWTLIIERLWFFLLVMPARARRTSAVRLFAGVRFSQSVERTRPPALVNRG